MKFLIPVILVITAWSPNAGAQSQEIRDQNTEEQAVSYNDLLLFDAESYSFPDEKRDDLSQCEGQDLAGMLRAVQTCWPVFQNYRDTKAYRHARAKAVALVNDPDADLEELDKAQADLLTEALLVPQVITEPRYPAQFELAIIAHVIRFKEFSRTRQYQLAREDANRMIGFFHGGKAFRETGLHNGILHLNRVDMNLAIDRPASVDVIERPENIRPIGFADIRSIFEGAFYDTSQKPNAIVSLGVDPERVLKPNDCSGRNYAGLLRAIRFCEPILRLYEDMRATDLRSLPLQLNKTDQIIGNRIVRRAEVSEFPAADFFALFALLSQSGAAYVSGDNEEAERLRVAAQDLLKQSKLDWNEDMSDTLDRLPTLVEEAKARQAAIDEASSEN
ncbi:hypothetical protein [Sphingorhabdus sp. Alg231-15]|uniref:hypothetical protein n=1 Tax=Sphingorhabdus sp. Alg231-15 TaxID=1922222 RepID=UPI000D55D8A4